MATPSKIAEQIALLEKQKSTTNSVIGKKVIDSKIEKLKSELTIANKDTKGTKATISKAKEKVSAMSNKEFSELISRLKQKPEFSFLKFMSKEEIIDDVKRVAKPKGWRIAGKLGNKRRPTASEIKKGVASNGSSVYYESRPERSDVSREVRLAGGGGVKYGRFSGMMSKYAHAIASYIDRDANGITFAEMERYLQREFPSKKFTKETLYAISRTLYKSNDYLIEDKKDWKESVIKHKTKMSYGEGGGVDMDEVEKSAVYYTDETKWSPKPTIEKFEKEIKENKELLGKLERKEITPSKIIGGGYKSSAVARKLAFSYLRERILISERAIEILKERGEKMSYGGAVKYPTDLKVGSVLEAVGFTMLKGLEGGNYYTIVEMDNNSATLVKSDKNGNKKSTKKVRHYLDSLEGGIKTATRGDNNGFVVIKFANGGGVDNFDYYDGAGSRTLDKLSLDDLKFQLKHTTKPHETEMIKYIKELIAKKEGNSKMANGGGVDKSARMYNFLKDDLASLETAIANNDQEEIEKFFSYWGQHLESVKTSSNERMYNFLSDDLTKLQTAIENNDQTEIDRFFSYWNYHLGKLKMANGGGLGMSYEIYAKNTKTGEESIVCKVKSYGDVPLIISGLQKGISGSPIEYIWKKSNKKFADGGGVGKEKFAKGGGTYFEGNSLSDYELEKLQGQNDGRGISLKQMKEIFNNKFPDSFGLKIYPYNDRNHRNLIPNTDNFYGIENEELMLSFDSQHEMAFRVFQGGENTYFYFALDGNDGNGYIGSFGFKDRGDVPKEYVTSFIAFLTTLYGYPFHVSHEVFAHGGSPEADMDDDGVTRGFFEDEPYAYAGGGNLVKGKKFIQEFSFKGKPEKDFYEIIDTKAVSNRVNYFKPVIKAKVYYSSVPERVGIIQEFTKDDIKNGIKYNFIKLFADGGTMGEAHRGME